MCGITGFFSFKNSFSHSDLVNMTNALSHRGPDALGYYLSESERVGLGHARLSILDLSENANQPMTSDEGRYKIVYNGEIYNYKSILPSAIPLKTSSDTEVVLKSFIYFGIDFIKKLNGMFAFSIYDEKEDKLFLFRDPLGIKPLFYFYDGENFAFSSEIKSLLKFPKVKGAINKKSIAYFLHLGYIPEPLTIYENIYKFPSGSYAILENSVLNFTNYWMPENQIYNDVSANLNSAKKELHNLIDKSVSSQMISDVEFGSFLSGGIDSSIVTAFAQKNSSKKIKTFSIGFKEEKFNEAPFAKEISKFLNTEHHEYIISQKDAIPFLEQIINTYDEPFADSSAIPTMILSKFAAQHVKMILSGDGGDELFMGYGSYKWARRLHNPLISTFKNTLKEFLKKGNNRAQRVSHLFDFNNPHNLPSHIFSQEQYFFSENELMSFLISDYKNFNFFEINSISQVSRKLSPEEKQTLFDIKYYLKDDLLVKVDRASMKYGLEVRPPLLDLSIVNFALNLSPELKLKNRQAKFLLKEVLFDTIPKDFFNRPKKGFSIPLAEWLKKDLFYLFEKYLSKEVTEYLAILDYEEIKKLKKDFLSGKNYLYNRLWLIIVLHKFLLNRQVS
jgi:asparagine synthase (glutamine-hydrolysing)